MWHRRVIFALESANLFARVELVGGKVRAIIDADRFLDIHCDPETQSYSYAVIDQSLGYAGDKRLFGWDDFPHIGIASFRELKSYPHHFQRRAGGTWVFEESPMRGDIENEINVVIEYVGAYLS